MNSLKTSLHMGETLTINDNKIEVLANKCSGKFVGEVTLNEYDAYGRKVFTERTYNDITLPGSVFILEKMFGIINKEPNKEHPSFMHPSAGFPIISDSTDIGTRENNYGDGGDIIVGFMAGIGGENGSGVYAPNYVTTALSDSNNNNTFIPFVSNTEITNHINSKNWSEEVNAADIKKYKDQYKFSIENNNNTYYYVKTIESPEIKVTAADGSGDVTEETLTSYKDKPVLAYVQTTLKIDSDDLRVYFGNGGDAYVNQIGLVSGNLTNGELSSVRLVTCVNFKSRDLSNSDNTLEIIYRLYCV